LFAFNQVIALQKNLKQHTFLISHIGKADIVAKNCTQRYGTIVMARQKRNSNGTESTYYQVKWDNNTTGEHAQARLCFETELPQILEDYTAQLYGT